MKLHKKVKVPIYGLNIHICATEDVADNIYGSGVHRSSNMGQVVQIENTKTGEMLILISFKDIDCFNADTISHESVHAAWKVLEIVGIKVDHENHEALAYLTGWISNEINKFYYKISANGDDL